MHALFEYLPLVIFFVFYKFQDVYWATASLIVTSALVLIVSNYVFNKNLLKTLIGENLSLPEPIWSRLNLSWALFFIFCGLLNIYIADNYPLDTWVNFKVFGLTVLTFIFAIGSIASVYKYLPKEEPPKESSLPTNNEK